MSGKPETTNQVSSVQQSQSGAAGAQQNAMSDAELEGVAGGADQPIALEGDISVYADVPEVSSLTGTASITG